MKLAPELEALDGVEKLPSPERSLHFLQRLQSDARSGYEAIRERPTMLRYFLTLASYSSFLAEAVIRHPEWLLALDGLTAPKSKELFARDLSRFETPYDLAAFRRRQLVRIVLRDALELATLGETTSELSDLADAILDAAYGKIFSSLALQFGTPETPTGPALFSVISLGKLGGCELNYSSDIDLLFIYSGDGETDAGLSNREFYHKLANQLTEMLSTYTGEGMCYRVDLRLRPDGRFGELCQTLEGARRYYQDRGRDWELQMLIKARVSAGNPRPGLDLLNFVEPSIYATLSDFTAIVSVAEARQRISDKLFRVSQGSGLDVKLTRGGIRDIEFLVQCLQRLHGAREPGLRHGSTQKAIESLRAAGLLTGGDSETLRNSYEFLRCLEHRLQFDQDRQTHTLPADASALEELSRRMPGRPPDLLSRVKKHLAAVQDVYARLTLDGRPEGAPVKANAAVATRNPARLEHFVERLTAHPTLAKRFEREAKLRACVLDIFEHSDFFAAELVRRPELIEEAEARGEKQTRTCLVPPVAMAALQDFFQRQMFRIQSESIHRAAPIFKTLKRTSDLADAVIAGAYQAAVAETLRVLPPVSPHYEVANQMMVIALGRLGMREFDLASDADLVFALPDRDAAETVFWTAVAGRLIHIVSSYTGTMLFAVDTRLRPNGREGALVQTECAFREYLDKHAEAWEGIAYMKARAVAGNTGQATQFLSELQQLDWRRYGQSGRARRQLAVVRAHLEREQGRRHPLKAGPGGYYDIDFALMYYRLKGAGMFYKSLTTPERIDIVEKTGHLDQPDAEFLREAATFYRALDHGLRISTGHAEGRLPAQVSNLETLVGRWARPRKPETLLDQLRDIQTRTRAFYERVFA